MLSPGGASTVEFQALSTCAIPPEGAVFQPSGLWAFSSVSGVSPDRLVVLLLCLGWTAQRTLDIAPEVQLLLHVEKEHPKPSWWAWKGPGPARCRHSRCFQQHPKPHPGVETSPGKLLPQPSPCPVVDIGDQKAPIASCTTCRSSGRARWVKVPPLVAVVDHFHGHFLYLLILHPCRRTPQGCRSPQSGSHGRRIKLRYQYQRNSSVRSPLSVQLLLFTSNFKRLHRQYHLVAQRAP